MKRIALPLILSAAFAQAACTSRPPETPRDPDATRPISSFNTSGGHYPIPRCSAPDGTRVQFHMAQHYLGTPYTFTNEKFPPDVIVVNVNSTEPTEPGGHIILPGWMYALPNEQRLTVIAHECAHQQLGHTAPNRPSPADPRVYERAADCEGISIMRRQYRMTERQIFNGIQIFNNGAPHLQDVGVLLPNGGRTHDSFADRYRLSLQCMQGSR